MDVILLKNIVQLGDKHDVISVKPGYGRNFLIPKGIAVIANKDNVKKLDEILTKDKAEEDLRIGEYQEILEKVKDQTLKIGVKAGTTGKIFGSITNVQIVNALKEQLDVEVARKKVIVEDAIKNVGSYEAKLELHPKVQGVVHFELIQE